MFKWDIFFKDKKINESFGQYLVPYRENKFNKLKGQKFFNFKEIEKELEQFKIWFYMIDAEKNTGKTYVMNKFMWKVENSTHRKMMFARKSRDEILALKRAMNNDSSGFWPFKVGKGNELYSKSNNRHVGTMVYLKGEGLQKFASMQFPEYDLVLVDEYQDDKSDNIFLENVRNFIIFLSNVQRDKPNLKVVLLGNNYSKFDPFRLYFKAQHDEKFLIDKDSGLFIGDFGGYFQGVNQNTNVHKLAKYDERLFNFMEKNESGELVSDILPFKYYALLKKEFQIIIGGDAFAVYKIENDIIAVQSVDKIYTSIPVYALKLIDCSIVQNTELISQNENFDIIENLIYCIKTKNAVYDNPGTKEIVISNCGMFLNKYLDKSKNLYGEL